MVIYANIPLNLPVHRLNSALNEADSEALSKGFKLPIMEHFFSIQGEGYHTGSAALFLRIGGCDVGCHWCDVKESWNAQLHPLWSVDEWISSVSALPVKQVVVTGGEPLLYNLEYLTQQLNQKGYKLHLETSGAYPLVGKWDWICVSPKKNKAPVSEIMNYAHELKVIIHNRNDFEWARKQALRVSSACKLYVQPEWSKFEALVTDLVEFVQNEPQWTISLQTHKFMRIP